MNKLLSIIAAITLAVYSVDFWVNRGGHLAKDQVPMGIVYLTAVSYWWNK